METKRKNKGFNPTPVCIVPANEKSSSTANSTTISLRRCRANRREGFTIVELLTVMSIIAILIGLLVPALNLARRMAKDTRQRAQFHSIDVALEIFNGENDGYPRSDVLGTTKYTVGAQHLAEALVGRDLLGFDPLSSWDAKKDYDERTTRPVYGYGGVADRDKSLERRRGPYLSSENVEAYEIAQLYGTGNTGDVYDGNAPVLTDVYRVKPIALTGRNVQAGTPILYYKADISSKKFPDLSGTDVTDPCCIYNCLDNEELIVLGTVKDKSVKHHYDLTYEDSDHNKGRRIFYNTITNPKITSQPRPYNMTGYILITAGFDGIYGTSDDITNFGE